MFAVILFIASAKLPCLPAGNLLEKLHALLYIYFQRKKYFILLRNKRNMHVLGKSLIYCITVLYGIPSLLVLKRQYACA